LSYFRLRHVPDALRTASRSGECEMFEFIAEVVMPAAAGAVVLATILGPIALILWLVL
jgi:ABC-type phosphate transport system permease subunit